MPFQELPHTADWCLRVWANDLTALFVESARGMNALSGAQPVPGPTIHRTLELTATDAEALLVTFLSELVFAAEQDKVLFTDFQITLSQERETWHMRAVMEGKALLALSKAIKAVTYHNLQIRTSPAGLEVEIVFDV